MKRLENFHYRPLWTTHIACIDSCQHFLGLGHSTAWVFGATGHAFIINMHKELCPSGPTAWKSEMIFSLASNLGLDIGGIFAEKSMPAFSRKQEEAWNFVRRAIDSGRPCYGWELVMPEYYLITGYDETGYLRAGCCSENGPGPTPWKELGASEIGILDVMSVGKCAKADNRKTVKDAFLAALRHASNPKEWIFPGYASGPKAYELWIAALEGDREYCQNHIRGMGYNANVWAECRIHAVKFIKEANARVPGMEAHFDRALGHYLKVRNALEEVAGLFPFERRKPEHLNDMTRRKKVVAQLKIAMESEADGLGALGEIAKEM